MASIVLHLNHCCDCRWTHGIYTTVSIKHVTGSLETLHVSGLRKNAANNLVIHNLHVVSWIFLSILFNFCGNKFFDIAFFAIRLYGDSGYTSQ